MFLARMLLAGVVVHLLSGTLFAQGLFQEVRSVVAGDVAIDKLVYDGRRDRLLVWVDEDLAVYQPQKLELSATMARPKSYGAAYLHSRGTLLLANADQRVLEEVDLKSKVHKKADWNPTGRLGVSRSGKTIWVYDDSPVAPNVPPPFVVPMPPDPPREPIDRDYETQRLRVFDVDFTPRATLRAGMKFAPLAVDVSSDDRFLATGVGPLVWDLKTGRIVRRFESPPVDHLEFAADDTLLIGHRTAIKAGKSWIVRFNIQTGKQVEDLSDDGESVEQMLLSPDRSMLAYASSIRVRVIDLRNAREVASWPTNEFVNQLCFSPDGRYLAACCGRPDPFRPQGVPKRLRGRGTPSADAIGPGAFPVAPPAPPAAAKHAGAVMVMDLTLPIRPPQIVRRADRVVNGVFVGERSFVTGEDLGRISLWKINP